MNKKTCRKTMSYFLFAYWHDPRWKHFVGATIKIWDMAENLHSMGNEVTLFLPKYNFNSQDANFKIIEVPLLDFPVIRLISYNLFLLVLLFTKYIKKKCRPDIVYVRRMTSIVPLLYAKTCKSLFFYEVNDDPYCLQKNLETKAKFITRAFLSTKIDEINLIKCDRAFVISKEVIEKIVHINPKIKTDRMIVMPSGANIQLFYPYDKFECRSRLKLESSNKYVGFIGSLLEHQGIDILIRAAPDILKQLPTCMFVIVGEGPMRGVWEQQVKKNKLQTSFIFTGQIKYEDVPFWISAMDVCVAPFLRGAGLRSPVKLFDYLACGKAIVASKISGTTDMFENSNAVVFVEAEKPRELSVAIINLIQDKQKIDKMGEDGRKLVVNKYDRKFNAAKVADEVAMII